MPLSIDALEIIGNILIPAKKTAKKSTTYDKVVKLAQKGLKPQEIASTLKISKQIVYRYLRRARKNGELKPQ
jgi:transposase